MQEQWSDICIQHICCITLQVHIIEHLTPPQPQGTTLVRIQEGEVYDDLGWQCHWFSNKHLIQLKNSVASFIEKLFWFFIFSCGLRFSQDKPFVFETSLRGISVSEVFPPRQFWKFCASHSFQIHFRPSVCIASSICCLKSPRSVFSLYTNWPRLRVQRWKLNNK